MGYSERTDDREMSEEDIASHFSFKYMLSVNAIFPLTGPYHFIDHSCICSSVGRSVDDVTISLSNNLSSPQIPKLGHQIVRISIKSKPKCSGYLLTGVWSMAMLEENVMFVPSAFKIWFTCLFWMENILKQWDILNQQRTLKLYILEESLALWVIQGHFSSYALPRLGLPIPCWIEWWKLMFDSLFNL